jgi:glycosyltransferase involved in cell wall biosynthesis
MSIKIVQTKDNPKVSIIIPSRDGDRRGNVARLLSDINKQDFQDFEIIMAIAESPNGHARNVGVTKAKGEYFLFIDDDAILGSYDMITKTLQSFEDEKDQKPGMIGCATLIPPDSNWFQRWVAKEEERSEFPPVSEFTKTDMAHHLFCMLPAKVWFEIGQESDVLETGTDMDLRNKLKKYGYTIGVSKDIFAYHPMPDNFIKFTKQNFWYGVGMPIMRYFWPEENIIISSASAYKWAIKSLLTFPIRVFKFDRNSKLEFKPLRAYAKVVRDIGYSRGYFKYRDFIKSLNN